MTTSVTRLDNGLTVATHAMDHLETASIGVFVATGARHETPAEHGISHLLEHMAFKGTERRSARQIAEEIEQVGGDLNASTSLEQTAYYTRVLKADAGLAIDVLADIVQNPLYDEAELAREKDVILQEMASIEDSPEELVYDLAQSAAFPSQSVGRPIIGTRESVTAISAATLREFLARRYKAGDIVLSAAGSVDHETIVRHARDKFSSLSPGVTEVGERPRFVGGTGGLARAFEQAHVVIGYEAPAYGTEEFFASQVLSGVLGGGMSSRLFQEVREKRGLCYAIYSSAWGISDGGMLAVYAATGKKMVEPLCEVVSGELWRMAKEPPTASEVERAKAQLKAGLLMGLESSAARAEQMARHLMSHGRLVATSEIIAKVEAVTGEAIRALAASMLDSRQPAVAIVGAGKRSVALAEAAGLRLAG